ncbi:MAG: V-type ATPase subunit [Lachnospiraceae bacterium]|nr:V-type ATPase subunit [Lachnospiraceae bacterium]
MNGLLAFSGVNTKIRAMQKNFISKDEFREIVSLPDVPSVIRYLRKYPSYQEEFDRMQEVDLHRGDVEFLLGNSVYEDYAKIYRFCNESQRTFLREYARRYAIKYLKKCLSYAFIGKTPNPNVYLYRWFYDKYTPLDMDALFKATTLETTLDALKGTEYYPVLAKVYESGEAQLFDYETALDIYHFRTMWKNKDKLFSKEGCEAITVGFGTKFDLLNIWYIHRARMNFGMSEADAYALTVPILYKLKPREIRAMVDADSEEAFQAAFAETYYGRRYKEFGPQDLGDLYEYVGRHVLAVEARKHPNSIAVMYRYLYDKEVQDAALTAAIECVRYGIPPDEAMANIAAMVRE